jgi:hypothetical protein
MTNDSHPEPSSSDLTFITNEACQSLRDRFAILLSKDTRFFDCLVGYFFISGFYRLYPALENVEKIRILVGLQTDRTAYDLLQRAKEQGELALQSHATSKEQVAKDVLSELEKSADSVEIETLKVLGILRRDISSLFFQSTRARLTDHSLSPREVILSSWMVHEEG